MTRPSHPEQPYFLPALAAALVVSIALVLAWFIYALQSLLQRQPERAVLITGAVFAAILAVTPGVYTLRRGRRATPETAGLLFLSTCSVLLLGIYFFWVRSYVFFPADIWIWSESDFLNDILKFSVGYPLYTPVANLDSSHYPPTAQLLTYLLAWITGQANSISVYRVIQVGYTAIAAFLATLCCRRILRLAWPESPARESWLWNGFWYAALFLIASNSITNPFAHNLNGDALAQLANMAAYYLLLGYMENRSAGFLAAMVFMPAIGFSIKQNLLIWGVFYVGFLAIWGRSWKRTIVFALSAAAVFSTAVAVCYGIWGPPFYFWIFHELSTHPVSPLRAFQHILSSWPYFAIGLLGGAVVLRRGRQNQLMGAWLIWIALIFLESYTSGIEWMLNHIGPGSLMAGVWFLAALASVWNRGLEPPESGRAQNWIQAAAVTVSVALLFSGLGMVRIPLQPVSDDAYRYVRDIEKEFQGQPAGRVLLDTGTWVYARNRVIVGDRATVTGMLGMGKIDGFEGFLSRISVKYYTRIMVHGLHAKDCWYENALWPKPSGIRRALLDNYREAGHIRAAQGPKDVKDWADEPHLFDEITILEPKGDRSGTR